MGATAILSSKGQVVIPAKLRHELGLKPGSRITMVRQGTRLIIEANDLAEVLALRGSYRGSGAGEYLVEQRRRERALAEAEP